MGVCGFANAQSLTGNTEKVVDFPSDTILDLTAIDVIPEYPGGQEELYKFISENFILDKSDYDKELLKRGTARIFVQFIIDEFGYVDDVKVIRGFNESLDAKAIMVVKAMPKWTPGYANGKPVKVKYMIPIVVKV